MEQSVMTETQDQFSDGFSADNLDDLQSSKAQDVVEEKAATPEESVTNADGQREQEEQPDWKTLYEKEQKRAKDHQAEYTRGQLQLSEMRKEFDALKKNFQEAQDKAKAQEPEYPPEVQTYFDDYPEAKEAMRIMAERLAEKKLKETLGNADISQFATLREQIAIQSWYSDVASGYYNSDGNYIPGIPDVKQITAPGNKAYWDWYESKGYGPCDPPTAIQRLSEWKTQAEVSRAAQRANVVDQQRQDKAIKMEATMKGAIPTSSPARAPAPKADPNDFYGGFNADKL